MCALSPCCKTESNNKIVVTQNIQTANHHLSQIQKKPDLFMVNTDSYTSGNVEYSIQAIGSKSNHRRQNVSHFNWDEFPQKKEEYRNKKTSKYGPAHS